MKTTGEEVMPICTASYLVYNRIEAGVMINMASPYHGDAVSREICRVLRLAYLEDRLEVVQYVRTLRLRLQIRLGPLRQRFKTNQLRTVSEQTLRQHQTQVRTS